MHKLEVPQPTVPPTPAVPDAPTAPAAAGPDPGTRAAPEEPATVPSPQEPPTPIDPDPGTDPDPEPDPSEDRPRVKGAISSVRPWAPPWVDTKGAARPRPPDRPQTRRGRRRACRSHTDRQ